MTNDRERALRLALAKNPKLVDEILGSMGTNTIDDDSIYVEIGIRVANLRKQGGLTQVILADAVGINRVSISNIEAGRQRSPIHVLYHIADALGTTIFKLLPKLEPT